jgi:NAD kinase
VREVGYRNMRGEDLSATDDDDEGALPLQDAWKTVNALLNGAEYTQILRPRISVYARDSVGVFYETKTALNEVSIVRELTDKDLPTLEIYLDESKLFNIKGIGVAVCTGLSSTVSTYNLCSGGPLVFPTITSLVLDPVCGDNEKLRPLVLPSDHTVVVHIPKNSRRVRLLLDDQQSGDIDPGSSVYIRMSNYPIHQVIHVMGVASLYRHPSSIQDIWASRLNTFYNN